MRLTREQQDAIERETNLVVTAGAGTGKTEVMTQRIIRVLNQLDDIRELLAVTFTEKAAGELRQRVYQAILRKVRESDGEERIRFERMRDRYLLNYISTMHAFFADLIRRFPHALDTTIAPDFRIVEGTEKEILLARSVTDLLDQIAYRSDHPLREDLRRWLRQTASKRTVTHALMALVDRRLHCREWVVATLNNGDDYAAIRRRFIESVRLQRSDFFCRSPNVLSLVARLREMVSVGSTDRLAVVIRDVLGAFDAGDTLALARYLTTHSGEARRFGNVGSARTFGGSKDQIQTARTLLNELAELVSRERFEDLAFDDAVEKPSAECLQSLARLADAAMSAYARGKSRLGVLDFADLEDYACRLLDNEQVLRALRKQFRAIFIDEFQDTNRTQWRLFKRLATEESGCFRENSLFIVGDAKQAIYAFRGGEVEVFELARREVGQSIGFVSNFRSRRNLLAFTNRFFSSLLTGGALYEAEAQRLRYQEEPDFPTTFVENGGSVRHLVVAGASPDEDATRPLEREARAIASLLRAICDGRRDDEYSDIRAKIERGENAVGILFRRTTHQSLYEDALRAYGVPFVAAKGKGYYEREEIRDLRNALRVVGDDRADIALAGVLRSPLMGCSDEGLLLYAAFCRQRGRTFASGLDLVDEESLRSCGVGSDDRFALIKAQRLIAEWRNDAQYVGVADLVSRILSSSGVYAAYAVGANGAQRIANAEKLIDLAREYESKGSATLGDFVRFLDAHLESTDHEGDADLPDAGSIQLLTVHRAKGLQWPLVIVPDTNAKFLTRLDENATPIAVGRLEEEGGPRAEVAMRFRPPTGKPIETAMWRILQRDNERRVFAEQKRLLYVAFTRAESHLIFCTHQREGETPLTPARSWADWIHAILASEFSSEEGRRLCIRTPAEELEAPTADVLPSDATPVAFDAHDLWGVPAVSPVYYRISDEPLDEGIEPPFFETPTPIAQNPERMRLGAMANRLLPFAWKGVPPSELESLVRSLTAAEPTKLRRTPQEIVAMVTRVAEWLRHRVEKDARLLWNRTFELEEGKGLRLLGLVDVLARNAAGEWVAYDVKYGESLAATLPSSYSQQAEYLRRGVRHVLHREDVRVRFLFADAERVEEWSPSLP